MKIRQTVKKAVALGTGALMLGATLLGASAANLSEYPTIFVKDGKVSAKIVVGADAKPIDVVGAIDIAADLQAAAVSKETVSVAGTGITVTGGKTKEIVLGATLADFATLGKTKVSSLKDEKITWNDKDIDVAETIDPTGMEVLLSEDDNDFGSAPQLGNSVGGLEYAYTLDDSDLDITAVSTEDPLKVEILGKSIEVINASTEGQITVSVANEYYMAVGDSVTIDGKKVTLKNVGSTAIVADVDGVVSTVTTSTDEKVNGVRISVVSTFDANAPADRSATVKLGDKITDTISDGESMELFGEPSRASDAEWVWAISNTSTTKLVIGANFNQNYDSDTEPVKAMGEKVMLPNNYASVYMDSLTATADTAIEFSFKDGIRVNLNEDGTDISSSNANYDDEEALMITADKEIFRVAVNSTSDILVDADTIYFVDTNNASIGIVGAFENSDGDLQIFFTGATDSEAVTIDHDATDGSIRMLANATGATPTGTKNVTLTLPVNGPSTANTILIADILNQYFGNDDTGYEAEDLSTGYTNVGKEDDYVTNCGIVISAIEDAMDDETFVVTIPSEQVKMNVVVVGKDGTSAGGSGSVTTDKVNAIGVDFGVLDSDAPAAGTNNLIIVGGPCVNTEAARIMGNPADCAEGFAQGEAKLAMFDDGTKVALLVAGYSGEDTLGATRALVTGTLPAKSSAKVVTTNYKTPSIQ